MNPIRTWGIVQELVAQARNDGLAVTNFFPDEARMAVWCRDGAFFEEHCGDTVFLVRRQTGFCNVYFLGRSPSALCDDWHFFAASNVGGRWIVDLIGPDRVREPLEAAFSSAGFERSAILQRMGRKTPEVAMEQSSDVECACPIDIETIKELLDSFFVAEEEQLPSMEEIEKWIEAKTLYVVKGGHGGKILGFTIFDLTPATLYLRYWFVHPESRGQGVGGRLLRAMFAAGRDTKRQYFWVRTDNANAIKRYLHYGFQFEPMKDVIMVCQNMV